MGTVRRAAGCETLVCRLTGCLGLRERLRLDAALVKAKAAERAAHAAFNALDNPLLDQLVNPGRKPSAAAVQAWETAMDHHLSTLEVIKNILERRHALATKGRPK